jgi:mono/diheme cytochrome c family protein
VEQTPAYLTAVGRANQSFNDQHVTARIEPGVPEASSIIYRMSERGNNAQMPPIGTTMIDEAGIALVEAWVESLQ